LAILPTQSDSLPATQALPRNDGKKCRAMSALRYRVQAAL
jgi:hypothetical protein